MWGWERTAARVGAGLGRLIRLGLAAVAVAALVAFVFVLEAQDHAREHRPRVAVVKHAEPAERVVIRATSPVLGPDVPGR